MAETQQSGKRSVGLNRPDAPYSESECEQIIQELEALLDGALSPEEEQRVQALIDDCDYCNEQYNLERSIRSVLKKGFGNVMASTHLLSNIRSRIQKLS